MRRNCCAQQNLRWRRAGRAAGQPKPRGVVNLSLKSVESASWEVAVNTMVSDGLVVVAAAGNDDQDACRYSPAAQARAITVGASNVDDTKAGTSPVLFCGYRFPHLVDKRSIVKVCWYISRLGQLLLARPA